jgi:hypothetical protein
VQKRERATLVTPRKGVVEMTVGRKKRRYKYPLLPMVS